MLESSPPLLDLAYANIGGDDSNSPVCCV